MTNAQILNIAMQQHAIDLSCNPEDFTKSENIVVLSQKNEKARSYLNQPLFCYIVSYGKNVVASVDPRVYDLIKYYINTEEIHGCFNALQASSLIGEFSKHGYLPCKQLEYWLPDVDALKPLSCDFKMQLLENKDFAELYKPEWGNALSQSRKHLDMLGVGAYDGDKLIGLAGCSADCDNMWQMGIDVLPDYRKKGIAAALTSRLAMEVLARGKVPFYCCSWANLASACNAIKIGFRPAWVELTTLTTEKALEWNGMKDFHKHKESGNFSAHKSYDSNFWAALEKLVAQSKIKIDRPKGSRHPKYPDLIYPADYGYLENTTSMDGGGIDIWKGSGSQIDAIICTVDLMKKDSEIKILIGCNEEEKQQILAAHNNSEVMKGILIRKHENEALK